MNNNNNNFKNIISDSPSTWKEKAKDRINKPWLREYSSQIARRILSVIENDEDLNQKKIADLLNVSSQQVSKIVQGQENLTLESIYKISKALSIELITFPPYKYETRNDQEIITIPYTEPVPSPRHSLNEQILSEKMYMIKGGKSYDKEADVSRAS